jgi:hypothetical protein
VKSIDFTAIHGVFTIFLPHARGYLFRVDSLKNYEKLSLSDFNQKVNELRNNINTFYPNEDVFSAQIQP